MANYKLDSIDLNAGRSELHNAYSLSRNAHFTLSQDSTA